MILDAAAANRTMWIHKNCKDIIYIDMEKKLTVKPTIFCDNTNTPFADKTFDCIFYDPPHFYNDTGSFYAIPDAETFMKKWKGYGKIPRYYGGDKYKTKHALLHHVIKAQKEYIRILKDDGLLWLKWNETYIKMSLLKHYFVNWHMMLQLPLRLSNPNRTEKQTYWVCWCKKEVQSKQATLF